MQTTATQERETRKAGVVGSLIQNVRLIDFRWMNFKFLMLRQHSLIQIST